MVFVHLHQGVRLGRNYLFKADQQHRDRPVQVSMPALLPMPASPIPDSRRPGSRNNLYAILECRPPVPDSDDFGRPVPQHFPIFSSFSRAHVGEGRLPIHHSAFAEAYGNWNFPTGMAWATEERATLFWPKARLFLESVTNIQHVTGPNILEQHSNVNQPSITNFSSPPPVAASNLCQIRVIGLLVASADF